jgi:hypothetical protein
MLFEIDGTGGAVAFFRKKIGRDGFHQTINQSQNELSGNDNPESQSR